MKLSGMKVFVGAVTVLVLVIAGYGAYLAGAPSKVRMESLDSRRVSDLQSISNAVEQYYRLEGTLPKSLEELKQTRDVYVAGIVDPETQVPYGYTRGSGKTYQLCAMFALEMKQEDDRSLSAYPYYYGTAFWNHPAGQYCYSFEVRPDPYAAPVK